MTNTKLWGDNTYIYRVGLRFLCTALLLIAIYLYTNSSFTVICKTRYRDGRADGHSGDYISHFGEHNKGTQANLEKIHIPRRTRVKKYSIHKCLLSVICSLFTFVCMGFYTIIITFRAFQR